MNILFWLLVGLMTALALAFTTLPLWRCRRLAGDPSAMHADVVLYRQRRAELDQDLKAGLLAEDEHRLALAELGRQLLVDTEGADTVPGPGRGPGTHWPLVTAVLLAPLLAIGLYLQVGGGAGAFRRFGSALPCPRSCRSECARKMRCSSLLAPWTGRRCRWPRSDAGHVIFR